MKKSRIALYLGLGTLLLCPESKGQAPSTWNVNANGAWTTTSNWSPAAVPNGVGSVALLNRDVTAQRQAADVSANLSLTALNFSAVAVAESMVKVERVGVTNGSTLRYVLALSENPGLELGVTDGVAWWTLTGGSGTSATGQTAFSVVLARPGEVIPGSAPATVAAVGTLVVTYPNTTSAPTGRTITAFFRPASMPPLQSFSVGANGSGSNTSQYAISFTRRLSAPVGSGAGSTTLTVTDGARTWTDGTGVVTPADADFVVSRSGVDVTVRYRLSATPGTQAPVGVNRTLSVNYSTFQATTAALPSTPIAGTLGVTEGTNVWTQTRGSAAPANLQIVFNSGANTLTVRRQTAAAVTLNCGYAVASAANVTLGNLYLGDQSGSDSYGVRLNSLTLDNGNSTVTLNKVIGGADQITANLQLNSTTFANVTTGGDTTSSLLLGGALSGARDFVKLGSGNITLAGTSAGHTGVMEIRSTGGTTFLNSAGTAISSPILQIGNSSRDGNTSSIVQLMNNTSSVTNNSNQIADTTLVRFDGSTATFGNRWAYLKLMGNNETVGGIQDTSREGVIENTEGDTNVAASGVLGVDVTTGLSRIYNGYMRDKAQQTDGPGFSAGAATLGFSKTGLGTQTLQGDRIQYTGPTTISQGTLVLSNITNPLGGRLARSFDPDDDFTSRNLVNNGTAPRLLTSGVNVSGTVGANAALELNATTNWTLGAPISGGGGIVKSGGSTTYLTADSSAFTGAVTTTAGNLEVLTGIRDFVRDAGNNFTRVTGTDVNGNADRSVMNSIFGSGKLTGASALNINSGTFTIRNAPADNELDTGVGSAQGRFSNTAPIISTGGGLNFLHKAGAANFEERLGALTLQSGQLNVSTSRADTGRTSILRMASLTRQATGAVSFIQNGEADLGAATNQVIFTTAPTLSNNIIGGWAVATTQKTNDSGGFYFDIDFATYTGGAVRPLSDVVGGYTTPASGANNNQLGGGAFPISSSTNLNIANANSSLNANATINSLRFENGRTLTLRANNVNRTLVVGTGGIISADGNSTITGGGVGSNLQGGNVGNDGQYQLNIWVGLTSGSSTNTLLISDQLEVENNGYVNAANIGNPTRLIKNGLGELQLRGTNLYTGGTTINQGGIEITNISSLGDPDANIYNAGNPMLDYLTINGGRIQLDSASSNILQFDEPRGITFGVNGASFALLNGKKLELRGPVSGPGSLFMGQGAGATGGVVELRANNTFTGELVSVLGQVRLAAGTNQFRGIRLEGGEVYVSSASVLPALTTITMNRGNVILGESAGFGSLAGGDGSLLADDAAAGPVNITVTQDVNTTFQGKITNSPNNLVKVGFEKAGSGILNFNTLTTLADQSTYSGPTIISGGMLTVNFINNRNYVFGSSIGTLQDLPSDTSSAPYLRIADRTALSFSGSVAQVSDRSFTIGTGNKGASILANGVGARATLTFTEGELRDVGTSAFLSTDSVQFSTANEAATFTLGGLNVGLNSFQKALADNGTGKLDVTKTGTGQWLLGVPGAVTRSASSYTGNTTIYAGTLRVLQNGVFGSDTAGEVRVPGGVLELAGVDYTGASKLMALQGGRLRTLAATTNSWAGSLRLDNNSVVEVGLNSSLRIKSGISGNGSLQKEGFGNLILEGNNVYAGGANFREGDVQLDYTTNTGSKLADAAGLTLGGGRSGAVLDVIGNAATQEVVSALTLNAGENRITRSSLTSTTQMLVNNITVNSGATLDIFAAANPNSFVKTDRLNTNGILGSWATVNRSDWAFNSTNAADGLINGYSAYAVNTWGASGHTTHTADSTITGANTGSLRFNEPAEVKVTLSGVNSVLSNGILQTPNAAASSNLITGGTLAIANTREGGALIVQQHSAGGLTIDSTISNTPDTTLTYNVNAGSTDLTVASNAAANYYVGMSVSGPGIPAGATIASFPSATVVRLSVAATAPQTGATATFNGRNGITKIGEGIVYLGGGNTFTGSVTVAGGTLSIPTISNGGAASPLGASAGTPANLQISGGTLQYTGQSTSVTRGFQVNEFGVIDVSGQGTRLGVSGNLAGSGRLAKSGPGTLNMIRELTSTVNVHQGGNNAFSEIEVNDGVLGMVYNNVDADTGNNGAANGASNRFGATNAAVYLNGGKMHLTGMASNYLNSSEDRSQQFGGQLFIGRGASEVRAIGAHDTNTTLILQDANNPFQTNRAPGGTVHFVEQPLAAVGFNTTSTASVRLHLPAFEAGSALTWATYREDTVFTRQGVNDFAAIEILDGGLISLDSKNGYSITPDVQQWSYAPRVVSEGGSMVDNNPADGRPDAAFNGVLETPVAGNIFYNSVASLRYFNRGASTVNIPVATPSTPDNDVLLLQQGAILVSTNVGNTTKEILGGKIMSNLTHNDGSTEFILHNWNPASIFRIGSQITNLNLDVDGPSGEPALTAITHFTQTGDGITQLSGSNDYTGNTFLTGGVLRLTGANALPGGIGAAGGTSHLNIDGGVLGLEADFSRALGTTAAEVEFGGSGGFSAYGATRTVNFGGAGAVVNWGSGGFVPDSSTLKLSSADSNAKIILANPVNLGGAARLISVADSAATEDAELSGALSGSGGSVTKVGYGTLRISGTTTSTGGLSVGQGTVITGPTSIGAGPVKLGKSDAAGTGDVISLVVNGGNLPGQLIVGNANALGITNLDAQASISFAGGALLDRRLTVLANTGRTVSFTSPVTGAGGFMLTNGGELNLAAANTFGSSGSTAGSAVNGAVIVRNGTVMLGNSASLGVAHVELGDRRNATAAVGVYGSTVGRSMETDSDWDGDSNGGVGTDGGGGAFIFQDRTQLVIDGVTYTTADEGKTFLLSGESANPERNGVYAIVYDSVNSAISLARVDPAKITNGQVNVADPSVFANGNSIAYDARVSILNGTEAGQVFNRLSVTSGTNAEVPVLFGRDTSGAPNTALLANAGGIVVPNTVDINAATGSTTTMGGATSLTTGSSSFTGDVVLQSLTTAAEPLTLRLTSSTNTGAGILFNGRLRQADALDTLSIVKTGTGTVTIGSSNDYRGTTTVNSGSLLVTNFSGTATGTGAVTVNGLGSTLGGNGFIQGATTINAGGVLSPGVPGVAGGWGVMEFTGALTMRDSTVALFSLGSDLNFDRVITRSALVVAPSTRLSVSLDFVPTEALSWDILDWASAPASITDQLELPTLAQSALYWDVSLFASQGVIALATATPTTNPPVRFAIKEADVTEGAVRVEVALQLQWPATKAVTVPLTVTTGAGFAVNSAAATGDVVLSATSVAFAIGETSKVVSINVRDDLTVEQVERLVVSIGTPVNATRGLPSKFTLTIRDNDPTPAVGSVWTHRNPLPTSETLRDVAANGSQRVAVGTCGLILVSNNSGSSWSRVWTGSSLNLNAVVWTGSRWVAVGEGGAVFTSTNTVTWTFRSAPSVGTLNDVLRTNAGGLVAVGIGGSILTSADGVDWMSRSSGITSELHSVAEGAGLLVAVGAAKQAVVSADSGVTWTAGAVATGSDFRLRGVSLHGAGFVAVGEAGAVYTGAVSGSSITWTAASSGVATDLNSVASDGTTLAAVGAAGVIRTSTNGTSWSAASSGTTQSLASVSLPVVGEWRGLGDAGTLLSSANGTSWSSNSTGSTGGLVDVATHAGQYVAIGSAGEVLSSADGITWNVGATSAAQPLTAVVTNGSLLVAVGEGGVIYSSTDAASWAARSSGSTQRLNDVVYAAGTFVVVGDAGTLLTSADGVTWTAATSGTAENLTGAAFGTSGWLVIGADGQSLASPDASVWTLGGVVPGAGFRSLVRSGSLWVAAGVNGTLATSADAVTWTSRDAKTSRTLKSLLTVGTKLYGVGDFGTIITSPDAISWTSELTASCQDLAGLATLSSQVVVVGARGTILTAEAQLSSTPTVMMADSSAAFSERAGTANIVVRLAPGASAPVTVPFTVTAGSATLGATNDYTVTTLSPLVFAAGDTEKLIAIRLVDNAVVEGDETLTVTLGTPTITTGTVLAGANTTAVTILNDDAAPTATLVTAPQHQMVALGSAVTLQATFSGSTPVTTIWQKNGASVTGAAAASYVLPAITTTQAGAYRYKVSNPVNTVGVLSAPVELGVVDTASRLILVLSNTSAVLTQVAGGNGLTYSWTKDGGAIPVSATGGTTNKLTIPGVTDNTKAGVYVCNVTSTSAALSGSVQSLAGGSFRVAVARVPVLTHVVNSALPAAYVGKLYTDGVGSPVQVQTSAPTINTLEPDGTSRYATTYIAAGLPAGLSIHPTTGVISGRPTTPVSNKVVTLTAKNIAGSSVSVNVTLTVNALPTTTIGKYVGLIARDIPITNRLGGRINLTSTAAGTFTGSVTIGAVTTPFTGGFIDPSSANPTGVATVKLPSKTTPVVINVTLDATTNLLTGTLTMGSASTNIVRGWRTTYAALPTTAQPTGRLGRHNVALQVPLSAQGDQSLPQGDSFCSMTVATSGVVTLAGKLADNLVPTALTGTVDLGPNGEVLLYQGLYIGTKGATGSLHGIASIAAATLSDRAQAVSQSIVGAEVTWSRGAQPTSARNYRTGFTTPITLEVAGGLYKVPVSPNIVLGGVAPATATTAVNTTISFVEGGLPTTHANHPNLAYTMKSTTVSVTTGITNPGTTTFTSFSATTGEFAGTFKLVDGTGTSAVTRTAKFYGYVVPKLSTVDDGTTPWDGTGVGFFALEQLPLPTTAPILTGQLVLDRAP